jgi:hypothetical protein
MDNLIYRAVPAKKCPLIPTPIDAFDVHHQRSLAFISGFSARVRPNEFTSGYSSSLHRTIHGGNSSNPLASGLRETRLW